VFDEFTINGTVLKLNDYFLQENYLLTSFHTVTIASGEREQSMHTDDGLIQLPRPKPLMGVVSQSEIRFNVKCAVEVGSGGGSRSCN